VALLAAASPGLYALVVAALDTCARRGELLTLQWRDVSFERGELQIRPEHSKTGIGRTIPLTARLPAILHQREHDPAGEKHKATGHVFGNAVGEKVASPKKAWETLVLRAHGHEPVWEGRGRLSAASRARWQA
jgi:integrase